MTKIDRSLKQGLAADDPVIDIVQAMDELFKQLNIDDSVFRNPSYKSDAPEKICGLTNIYLKPVRIGRKAMLGKVVLYYGRKVHLFPEAYEIVEFNAASDIAGFIEKRLAQTLTEYMSIQKGNQQLDIDIREGIVSNLGLIGFDDEFEWLKNGNRLSMEGLRQIIMAFINL